MANRVRVVTDSTACFESMDVIGDLDITIAAAEISIGDRSFRAQELDPQEFFQRIKHSYKDLSVSAPSAVQFDMLYQDLVKTTDSICVLATSQQITQGYANAQAARASLLGRCDITVIDSQTTSLGLGYLAEEVAKAALDGASLDDVVQIARSAIPRIYSVYYVDSLNYVQHAGLIGETQAILGGMLNIKPILTIEDGKLIVMEKVRTHSQAIDKMVEFVSEFTHVERLGILQNTQRVTDRTRMLQDRLTLSFARSDYPIVLYDPLLARLIGPDAMGMVVLEGDEDLPEDYLD